MAQHFEKFLSKVIDAGSARPITEHALTSNDAPTEGERKALEFIQEYAHENGGQAPSLRTTIENNPDFNYREGCVDSFRHYAKYAKEETAIREVMRLTGSEEANDILNQRKGTELVEYLQSKLEDIKMGTSVRDKEGTDIKRDTQKVKDEYLARKAGDSFTIWKSNFSVINNVGGGYISGNVYVPYGKSGRGKSAITTKEALYMAEQGANVLIWSMEMGWFEVMVRLFSYYSADQSIMKTEFNGVNFDAGFETQGISQGSLTEDFERAFFDFIDSINETLAGNIVVRGVDDEDFHRKDMRQLESEIIKNDVDVVVIDPFYDLDYEKNTSKTAGGDAANTTKYLRRLAGKTKTVIFAITQADETDEQTDDDGNRELDLPKRKDVSKTKALMQYGRLLIAIDTNYREGRGLVGINKGRDGGEGEFNEITYLPQVGVIKEIEMGALAADQFTKVF
ncbi:DnaB-like helicase C-terminal domain-containing protein [Thalassobacillus sp. CUG 92003]|uniref:DnaB-like helicase C-terminal domain-containing protein n=1 Tax=Thalassobacillus sp. CUG 92003 TaxID=2736641 RepID=UPI0015E7DDAE|nr:DnaB-like helicase C-terminal domain-containing protein [Thalassobacillus sp. CUG 92003]